jgi:hypothetical protein
MDRRGGQTIASARVRHLLGRPVMTSTNYANPLKEQTT